MKELISLTFFFIYWISTVIGMESVIIIIKFFANDFKIRPLKIDDETAVSIFVIGLIVAIALSS